MIRTIVQPALAAALLLGVSVSDTVGQYKPITYTEYTLPNGLHVILHEDHSAPVVATVVHYRVGSRDEDPQRTGFAHFFEHLMFEATDNIQRGTIDKLINGAGGQLNAFTSQDATVYHFVVPSNEVRLALWIEAQRMRKLHVNEIGVETQRGVVKEERKNRYDNAPYGGWLEKQLSTVFAGTPYAWSPIGAAQHIDVASIPEFVGFYNTYYQPNNAVVVVSGDFDPAVVRETIETYFGGYPSSTEPPRPSFTSPVPLTKEVREVINDAKAQLPALFMSYSSLGMKDKDVFAVDILTEIMSSGESSRMYRTIVDSQQAAVQVSMFNMAREYAGAMSVVGIAAPGRSLDDVEKSIDAEIERLVSGGVTDAEVAKAKAIIEAKFIGQRIGVYDKAMALADARRFMGDAAHANTEIDRYLAVTKEDVQRVARTIFGSKNRSVLHYLPVRG